MNRLRRHSQGWQRREHCGREGASQAVSVLPLTPEHQGGVELHPRLLPAVLVNTSLCAELSEIMAAAAAAVVGSLAGVRSKVRVPEVVNCPDGDTVTVEGEQTF